MTRAGRMALARLPHDARGRTVIGQIALSAARTPVVVVRLERNIDRCIAFVAVTEATPARRLAAAVVVGDHVVEPVGRIVTGADPGDGRHLGARRTAVLRAAAAAAKVAVDRAVPPVIAALRIL